MRRSRRSCRMMQDAHFMDGYCNVSEVPAEPRTARRRAHEASGRRGRLAGRSGGDRLDEAGGLLYHGGDGQHAVARTTSPTLSAGLCSCNPELLSNGVARNAASYVGALGTAQAPAPIASVISRPRSSALSPDPSSCSSSTSAAPFWRRQSLPTWQQVLLKEIKDGSGHFKSKDGIATKRAKMASPPKDGCSHLKSKDGMATSRANMALPPENVQLRWFGFCMVRPDRFGQELEVARRGLGVQRLSGMVGSLGIPGRRREAPLALQHTLREAGL